MPSDAIVDAEPLLDAGDIQGDVMPGFHRKFKTVIAYRASSEQALRQALGLLGPLITSMSHVLPHKQARKLAFVQQISAPTNPELWVNVALGPDAVERPGDRGVRGLDTQFDAGMKPGSTGDPNKAVFDDGTPNLASPSNWIVGGPNKPIDLLLIAGHDDDSGNEPAGRRLVELTHKLDSLGMQEIHRDLGRRLEGDKEHFGFADGISEVGVRGWITIDGSPERVAPRFGVPSLNGVDFGRPGQALAWPGQFLVGSPRAGGHTESQLERYTNGSFLVFRRLLQNVPGFMDETSRWAACLSKDDHVITPDKLRAMIVGRWPSGAAVMRHDDEPPTPDDVNSANYFAFGSAVPNLKLGEEYVTGAPPDDQGFRCPAFAHIRKVNPRDLDTDEGGPGLTRDFQMLRRGIPFGPDFDHEHPDNPANLDSRGLLFFGYQRDIAAQFVQLNSKWMNSDTGPTAGGYDLFIGQLVDPVSGRYRKRYGELRDDSPSSTATKIELSTWVTPSGGAYLFAPSLKHIAYLASPPAVNQPSHTYLRRFEERTPSATGVEHDGFTLTRRSVGREVLVLADWRETSLREDATAALSLPALQRLDLSGRHFPTENINVAEAQILGESLDLTELAVDGVTLGGASLSGLLARLPALEGVDLAGCDLDDADIETLVTVRPTLRDITVGIAPPRSGHRFTAGRLSGRSLEGLARLVNLRRVGLRGVELSDTEIIAAQFWDRVEAVDIGETAIGDAAATRLGQSPKLRELRLDSTQVSDVGVAGLLDGAIESLSLANTRVTTAGFASAAGTSQLRTLDVSGCDLDDEFAGELGRFIALRAIDISRTKVGDRVAESLASLEGLDTIKVAHTAMTLTGVRRIAESNATVLDISGLPIDPDVVTTLAEAEALRSLKLSASDDWSNLERLNSEVVLDALAPSVWTDVPQLLTSITVKGYLTTQLIDALAPLARLRSVRVDGAIAAANLPSGFEALTDLRAERAGLTDGILSSLLRAPALQALYISGNPIGPALDGVSGSFIHTLELRDTQVDDNAIEAISQLPRLHCIDVPGTAVTPDGVARLATSLTNLQSLAIDGTQVDALSVDALSSALRLTELYLYGNQADVRTIEALRLVRIRDLQLVDTAVGDDAIDVIASMPRLRTLVIDNGAFTSNGISILKSLRPDLAVVTYPVAREARSPGAQSSSLRP